jgi:polyisoprenoid-binding protein YceI
MVRNTGDEQTGRQKESATMETATAASPPTPAPAAQAETRWALDASHSHVSFSVRHLMISNVRGEFGKVSGEAVHDPQRPELSRISASIEVASINTRDEKRDAHLRSPDFFDVDNHPTITFTSRVVRRRGDGLEVVGDLTIHGVTRETVLAVEEVTPEHTDPWGNRRIGASARTRIRRSDFGMRWNAALETGGVLVGDEVNIQLEAELVRQA